MATQTEQAARLMLAAVSSNMAHMDATEAGDVIVRMAKAIERERKMRRDLANRGRSGIGD